MAPASIATEAPPSTPALAHDASATAYVMRASLLRSLCDPSAKSTSVRTLLELGTSRGEPLASSSGAVSLGCTIVTRAPSGSGKSRFSGTRALATGTPHSVQLAKTELTHSFTAPTATPICQKCSLPLGATSDTPALPDDTAISSMPAAGL